MRGIAKKELVHIIIVVNPVMLPVLELLIGIQHHKFKYRLNIYYSLELLKLSVKLFLLSKSNQLYNLQSRIQYFQRCLQALLQSFYLLECFDICLRTLHCISLYYLINQRMAVSFAKTPKHVYLVDLSIH